MRNARIILITICAFATISAILAYKIRGISTFYSEDPANGHCYVTTHIFYTTTNSGGFLTHLSTASTTSPCPTIRVTSYL